MKSLSLETLLIAENLAIIDLLARFVHKSQKKGKLKPQNASVPGTHGVTLAERRRASLEVDVHVTGGAKLHDEVHVRAARERGMELHDVPVAESRRDALFAGGVQQVRRAGLVQLVRAQQSRSVCIYAQMTRNLHTKHKLIRNICNVSLLFSALYAKCPYMHWFTCKVG